MKLQPRSTGIADLQGAANDLAPRGLSTGAGATLPIDIVLFDGDGNPATTNDRVELVGFIGGTTSVGFTLAFDWGLAETHSPAKCSRASRRCCSVRQRVSTRCCPKGKRRSARTRTSRRK